MDYQPYYDRKRSWQTLEFWAITAGYLVPIALGVLGALKLESSGLGFASIVGGVAVGVYLGQKLSLGF